MDAVGVGEVEIQLPSVDVGLMLYGIPEPSREAQTVGVSTGDAEMVTPSITVGVTLIKILSEVDVQTDSYRICWPRLTRGAAVICASGAGKAAPETRAGRAADKSIIYVFIIVVVSVQITLFGKEDGDGKKHTQHQMD